MMPDAKTHRLSTRQQAILDAALEYADRDFSVIPVQRETKRPYLPWREYQKRRPTREEIEAWWQKWPEANVAVVCGRVSGIFCVDADGPAGIEWINRNLPKTSVYSITSRGIHAIYKIPPNAAIRNRVRLAPEVDIRGEGGYFVAPPSIHESGHIYRWRFLLDGWDDLVEFQPAHPYKGHDGNIDLDLSGISEKLDLERIFEGVPQGERDVTLFRYASRLRGKGLSENEAWILLKTFAAQCDPPFPEEEARAKLRSAWRYEPHQAVSVAKALPDDLEILIKPKHGQAVPRGVLQPGGILQAVMNFTTESSAVSHPLYDLAGALVLLGTLIGQRVMTETGLRTNIYAVAVGFSGSGKDSPQRACPAILAQTAAYECKGPDTLTSDSALLKFISNPQRARCAVYLDEMGLVLKGLKRPNSAAFEIPKLLMTLFSSTDRPHVKPYATGEDLVVKWHHVSIYGTSTPVRFWEQITRSEATDGFLARILLFESLHDVGAPRTTVRFDVPTDLVQALNDLAGITPKTAGGNLENVPIPFMIGKTGTAHKRFYEWADSINKKRNAANADDEGIGSIYGRAAEHAHKLALIHAASKCGSKILNESVGIESVDWAISVVDHCVENMVRRVEENAVDNEFHALCQRVLATVTKNATTERPGVTRRILTRRIKVPARLLDEAIANLKEAGQLVEQPYQPKRGPTTTIYCAVKEKPVT